MPDPSKNLVSFSEESARRIVAAVRLVEGMPVSSPGRPGRRRPGPYRPLFFRIVSDAGGGAYVVTLREWDLAAGSFRDVTDSGDTWAGILIDASDLSARSGATVGADVPGWWVWSDEEWVLLIDVISALASSGGVPVGSFHPHGGTVLPANYLWCDGTAVSRTTYATLFAAIGTAYGVGDTTTTFNVPDCRGRTVVGVKSADADYGTLGAVGGAKQHTHTQHGVADHSDHDHNQLAGVDIQPYFTMASAASGYRPGTYGANQTLDHTVTDNHGASADTTHIDPFVTAHWIIRYQ